MSASYQNWDVFNEEKLIDNRLTVLTCSTEKPGGFEASATLAVILAEEKFL